MVVVLFYRQWRPVCKGCPTFCSHALNVYQKSLQSLYNTLRICSCASDPPSGPRQCLSLSLFGFFFGLLIWRYSVHVPPGVSPGVGQWHHGAPFPSFLSTISPGPSGSLGFPLWSSTQKTRFLFHCIFLCVLPHPAVHFLDYTRNEDQVIRRH